MRSYSESLQFKSFEDRFNYLKLNDGMVGDQTFYGRRYLNQNFYRSLEWKQIRNKIIVRDNGCDLGIPGREIKRKILIHHIDPITIDDLIKHTSKVTDEDNLICVSFETHNALHYGSITTLPQPFVERFENDTCPWKV